MRGPLLFLLRFATPQTLEALARFLVQAILEPASDIRASTAVPHLLVPTGEHGVDLALER
jgi:hypothetical protein